MFPDLLVGSPVCVHVSVVNRKEGRKDGRAWTCGDPAGSLHLRSLGSSHVLPWSPSIAPSPSRLLFQSQTLLKARQRLLWALVPQGGDSACPQLVCAVGQES